MIGQNAGRDGGASSTPLSDPVSESRRLVAAATDAGITARVLGGVAVCLQTPSDGPLRARTCADIDLATPRGGRRKVADLLKSAGYVEDEMFNTVHGARR